MTQANFFDHDPGRGLAKILDPDLGFSHRWREKKSGQPRANEKPTKIVGEKTFTKHTYFFFEKKIAKKKSGQQKPTAPTEGKAYPDTGRGLTPAKMFDPDPGRGLNPAKIFDPDPGRGLTQAKIF